jgi:hypothetical protein
LDAEKFSGESGAGRGTLRGMQAVDGDPAEPAAVVTRKRRSASRPRRSAEDEERERGVGEQERGGDGGGWGRGEGNGVNFGHTTRDDVRRAWESMVHRAESLVNLGAVLFLNAVSWGLWVLHQGYYVLLVVGILFLILYTHSRLGKLYHARCVSDDVLSHATAMGGPLCTHLLFILTELNVVFKNSIVRAVMQLIGM